MTAELKTAADVRRALAFDVQRLRAAAGRLQAVDDALVELKRRLEDRAVALSGAATCRSQPEIGGDGTVPLRYAQAQATAQLARRSKLGEVLARSAPLSLIASMAVSRWIQALVRAEARPQPDYLLKGHIDAGRVAHRMLVSLRRKDRLKSGCGQLTSAVLVADLVHPDNLAFVEEQILEGLYRGRSARGVRGDEDVLGAASRALRAAATLLESMAVRAEPAAEALRAEADGVEAKVEKSLSGAGA